MMYLLCLQSKVVEKVMICTVTSDPVLYLGNGVT